MKGILGLLAPSLVASLLVGGCVFEPPETDHDYDPIIDRDAGTSSSGGSAGDGSSNGLTGGDDSGGTAGDTTGGTAGDTTGGTAGDTTGGTAGDSGGTAGDTTGGTAGDTTGGTAGDTTGGTAGDSGGTAGDSGGPCESKARDYFEEAVSTSLNQCRICHFPQGTANKPEGRGLQFEAFQARASDFDRLVEAVAALGGANPDNRILAMASDPEHTGMTNWKPDEPRYINMLHLLELLADPNDCDHVAP